MKYTNKNLVMDSSTSLREKSVPVTFPMSENDLECLIGLREYVINSLDDELVEKFDLSPAVGLAAPQIGVNKKMAVVYIEYEKGVDDICLINPKIVAHSSELTYVDGGEACLSVKEQYDAIIERYQYIKVKYQDTKGEIKTLEASGFTAIAIQHEIDHLNGILFYDHINKKNPYTPSNNSFPV